MKKHCLKTGIKWFITIAVIGGYSRWLYCSINNKTFTASLVAKYNISIPDFLSLNVDFISIIITIVLGVIVYIQSERINHLEIAQYNTYIGVKDVNYDTEDDTDSEDYIKQLTQKAGDFELWQDVNRKNLFFRTSPLEIGLDKKYIYLLPIQFITKNELLITRIRINEITLSLTSIDDKKIKKTFKCSTPDIRRLFEDNSTFILEMPLLGLNIKDDSTVEAKITMHAQNQIGKNQKYVIECSLNQSGKVFTLVDSHTN